MKMGVAARADHNDGMHENLGEALCLPSSLWYVFSVLSFLTNILIDSVLLDYHDGEAQPNAPQTMPSIEGETTNCGTPNISGKNKYGDEDDKNVI